MVWRKVENSGFSAKVDWRKMENSWIIEMDSLPASQRMETANNVIRRMPTHMANDMKKNQDQPCMFAFGPYHHDHRLLRQMEVHKQRAAESFIRRSGRPLIIFYKAVSLICGQLMACYERLPPKWREEKTFVQMMVTDGCAVIEIIRSLASHLGLQATGSYYDQVDYPPTDPIFGSNTLLYGMPFILRDLLTMENQVPMALLVTLLAVQTGRADEENEIMKELCTLILQVLNPSSSMPANIQGIHILDVYRKSLIHGQIRKPISDHVPRVSTFFRPLTSSIKPTKALAAPNSLLHILSATELSRAGVSFKRSETTNLKDVHFFPHSGLFGKKATLILPNVAVDRIMKVVFFNLLAYERLHNAGGRWSELTSFFFLMSSLMKSVDDVQLLLELGIIEKNSMYSNEEVVTHFTDLSRDIPLDPCSEVAALVGEMNNFCNSNGAFQKAAPNWRRYPFMSALILALTLAQAIFAIYPYYNKHSS